MRVPEVPRLAGDDLRLARQIASRICTIIIIYIYIGSDHQNWQHFGGSAGQRPAGPGDVAGSGTLESRVGHLGAPHTRLWGAGNRGIAG